MNIFGLKPHFSEIVVKLKDNLIMFGTSIQTYTHRVAL